MTVEWSQTAREELAGIWIKADSNHRRAITAAADLIDKRLYFNAKDEGESRENDQRVLFEAPLGILFALQAKPALVRVVKVWLFR